MIEFPKHYMPEAAWTLHRTTGYFFVVTGSRFFGLQTPESDWDFFTEDTGLVRQFLIRSGFKMNETSYSYDKSIKAVFEKDNVHVQLIDDVLKKIKIQNKLFSTFRLLKPNKVQARWLWKLAYDIAYDIADDV